MRDEEAVARARDSACGAGGSAKPEDDAPVRRLELVEARHRRGDGEPLGIAGVDAGDERIGDARERLAAEPAPYEVREALVARAVTARQHEVERHAELPGPGE